MAHPTFLLAGRPLGNAQNQPEVLVLAFLGLILVAWWIGHACIWTALLNHLYGRPITKRFLKPWRLFTGVVIAFTIPAWLVLADDGDGSAPPGLWAIFVVLYWMLCLFVAFTVFPAVTIFRLLRRNPRSVLHESTRTLDLWPELGEKLVGEGKWHKLTRLPGNGVFRVDFTDLTLAPRDLPPEWDGLTILLLSDLHFHGSPSQAFFHRVIDEINRTEPADIVVLAGDYVDTDAHHEWIAPILGRLKWKEHGFAILGNHDDYHDAERVREALVKAGFSVLAKRTEEVTVRDQPLVVVGHEGPWFPPPHPAWKEFPPDAFRLCVSHTPDNFYWGQQNRINLMLCGHVHGGQIRVPVVGSIFVPSVYSRRFDRGVFEENGTLMVVGRGLSGKEPLRFRCNPQVIRITLKSKPPGDVK